MRLLFRRSLAPILTRLGIKDQGILVIFQRLGFTISRNAHMPAVGHSILRVEVEKLDRLTEVEARERLRSTAFHLLLVFPRGFGRFPSSSDLIEHRRDVYAVDLQNEVVIA